MQVHGSNPTKGTLKKIFKECFTDSGGSSLKPSIYILHVRAISPRPTFVYVHEWRDDLTQVYKT